MAGFSVASRGLAVNRVAASAVTVLAPTDQFVPLGNVTTTVTLNAGGLLASTFTATLTAPLCVFSVINAVAGSQINVITFQDSSPPRMVQHPAVTAWTSSGPPTLSGNANAPDRFAYTVITVDGSGVPTQMVGSLGFTSGVLPAPINPPIVTEPPVPFSPPVPS